jgi:hypothetical protein
MPLLTESGVAHQRWDRHHSGCGAISGKDYTLRVHRTRVPQPSLEPR